ncbi:MAG: PASTA domain-containing protein [Muribaculaceae bacterium]|nr:PASTA domain-containing protein [Muribaculaceae bacterium]
MDKIIDFFKRMWTKHPILSNIILIIISLLCLAWITLCFLDIWTHHGQVSKVPNVINMGLTEGVKTLREADLEVVVADSVYRKDLKGGTIVDIIPQPGAIVKADREVYVTIVAFSAEPVIIDMLLTDISWRQAEAYLKAKGLKVEKRYVPSQYPDLVVAVKCRGKELSLGSKVTIDDVITLEVGQAVRPTIVEDALDDAIGANIYVEGSDFESPEMSEDDEQAGLMD